MGRPVLATGSPRCASDHGTGVAVTHGATECVASVSSPCQERAAFKLDVRSTQPQRLTLPQSQTQRDCIERAEPILTDCSDELLSLLPRQYGDPASRHSG